MPERKQNMSYNAVSLQKLRERLFAGTVKLSDHVVKDMMGLQYKINRK